VHCRRMRYLRAQISVLWLLGAAQACSGDSAQSGVEGSSAPTYWKDVAPLMAEHCLQCHREGGIAPVTLDDYAKVKPLAAQIEQLTRAREMPPWSATSDGSCGEFANSLALRDDEIELISDWVESGAREGTPAQIAVPDLPALADATEFVTPEFTPEIQGGDLAPSDEYRCFALDVPAGPTQFITGYDVVPGRPEIIHHVIAMVIDPNAPADLQSDPARTNLEQMRMLDDESPARDGWPCYGMAGDGMSVEFNAVVWAPGQGVINFPNHSGVPLPSKHKLVIQVHYNLSDPQNIGKSDRTTLRLHFEPQVENVGLTALPDPFLQSLDDAMPRTLPPGQRSTVFNWTRTGEELGLSAPNEAQLFGVMPHMHQLGRKYHMIIADPAEAPACAVDIQSWDFHWQRMYFYEQPRTIRSDSSVSVSCDYDTSSVTEPVLPGWGTRNEMCLATLYLTVPFPKP
jgi:mono/diheme cytochrome c family protein